VICICDSDKLPTSTLPTCNKIADSRASNVKLE
jgi:hypothetical protein